MHFHYLSFDKHFSFLSKHDKSSVFLHTVLDVKFVQIKTRQIRNIQPKHCIIGIRDLAGKFGTLIPLMESMGIYQNLSF